MQASPPVLPGVYPGPGQASLLRANTQQFLFQSQAVAAGQSSIAVQLERIKGSFYPFAVSFEITFASLPASFQLDIQTADNDQDASFVTVLSVNVPALNAQNVTRVEMTNTWAKFVRAQLVNVSGGGNLSVQATR